MLRRQLCAEFHSRVRLELAHFAKYALSKISRNYRIIRSHYAHTHTHTHTRTCTCTHEMCSHKLTHTHTHK
jgi:hypothetical protein